MKGRPWYPKNTVDYARDTHHLTLEQHGAYNLLIDLYWEIGPLPADDKLLPILRSTWGISTRKTKCIWNEISTFFQEKNGVWHHKRIDKELEESQRNHSRLAEASRKANKKRWSRRESPGESPGESLDNNNSKTSTYVLGADAPMDPRKVMWITGVQVFAEAGIAETSARKIIGHCIKRYGESAVAEKLAHLAIHAAADPTAWLEGALNGKNHNRHGPRSAVDQVRDATARRRAADPNY